MVISNISLDKNVVLKLRLNNRQKMSPAQYSKLHKWYCDFNAFLKYKSDKHANVDRWKKIRVITCLVYETYDRAGAF